MPIITGVELSCGPVDAVGTLDTVGTVDEDGAVGVWFVEGELGDVVVGVVAIRVMHSDVTIEANVVNVDVKTVVELLSQA